MTRIAVATLIVLTLVVPARAFNGSATGEVKEVEPNGKFLMLDVSATDPADDTIVGKTIKVGARWTGSGATVKPNPTDTAYIKSLKVGQTVTLDIGATKQEDVFRLRPVPKGEGEQGADADAAAGDAPTPADVSVTRGGTTVSASTDPYYSGPLQQDLAAFPQARLVLADTQEAVLARVGPLAGPGRASVVTLSGDEPFTHALRVETHKPTEKPWGVQNRLTNAHAIENGDLVYVTFWARAFESPNEAEDATGYFVVKPTPAAGKKEREVIGWHTFVVGPEWQRFHGQFRAKRGYAADALRFEMFYGRQKQQIDVAGLAMVNVGPGGDPTALPREVVDLNYAGREADAPWRAEAQARIEKIRKADLRIVVTDAAGQPVPNAVVRAVLKRHAFAFGTTVNAQEWSGKDGGKVKPGLEQRYRELLTSGMFNRLSTASDLKWPAWTGDWKGFRRECTMGAINELNELGFEVKGHVLTWGFLHADREAKALKDDPAALQSHILEHIRNIVSATKGKLVVWDVVNEHFAYPDFTNAINPEAAAAWFAAAHETDPRPRLFWNEATTPGMGGQGKLKEKHTLEWVKRIKDAGAPIHGIGLESHVSMAARVAPQDLLDGLDRFAALGLDIEATEFDIDVPDANNPQHQQFQADYVRDFLTVFFSHPSVTGVTYWTPIVAKWKPKSALTDEQMNLRPHGVVWQNLVTKTWHTDATLTTDNSGAAATRGFKGRYEIVVTSGQTTHTVNADLKNDGGEVTVRLP